MEEDKEHHCHSHNETQSHTFTNHKKTSFKYKISYLSHKFKNSLLFVIFANLFWLVCRSGTKPSRIVYPCQKAAIANISTFAILLLYSEKIKLFLNQDIKLSKLLLGVLVAASIAGLFLLARYNNPIIPPIEPGVHGKVLSESEQEELGINTQYATIPAAYDLPSPHRVVAVHNSNSTTWKGVGNPNNYMNQSEIDKMVEIGIMELTGTTSPQDGWRKIIPYKSGETVAIKVNFNNNWHYTNGFYFDDDSDTSMLNYAAIVNSVIKGLRSIGVPSENIWITDPSRPVHDQFRERIYDKEIKYYVNENSGPYIEGRPNIFLSGYVSDNSEYASTSTAYAEKIKPAKIFVNATYIINMPQLKGHGFKTVGRVTLSLKNNFGSVSYTADAHGRSPAHNADSFAKLLADINNNPVFRNKTRLIIGDGIMGNPNVNTAPPTLWKSFGNKPPETLFFGVDPVATDSVMIDYIRREVGSQAIGLVEFYAAELGLGVLESWNDQEKYTYIDYRSIDLDNQTYDPLYVNPTVNKNQNEIE
jgi:hypothetical protein